MSSGLNIIKLYFYIFALIFLARAAFKWQDTTFLPQVPEIAFNEPVTDFQYARINTNYIKVSGVADVRWSSITNRKLWVSNLSGLTKSKGKGLYDWSNTVELAEGTNYLYAYAASRNGLAQSNKYIIIEYEPNEESFIPEPEHEPFTTEDIAVERGINPNIIFYVIMLIIDGIGLLGIFGYAYHKEFFTPKFWKFFMPFFYALEIYLLIGFPYRNFFVFLFALSFILPAFYTIYLYAFKFNWVENLSESEKYHEK